MREFLPLELQLVFRWKKWPRGGDREAVTRRTSPAVRSGRSMCHGEPTRRLVPCQYPPQFKPAAMIHNP